jgi:hypothetical protein
MKYYTNFPFFGGHFENGRHPESDTETEVANGFFMISMM